MEQSTTPETEVQSPEDRLASLLGADDEAEQEVDEATPEADESEAEQETEADEEEAKDEPEDEAEEVEFEGKAYKVPAEIKRALLRQEDYTRKTQEVADRRREVEERTKLLDNMEKLRSENFEQIVNLQTLDAQLQQFQNLNWDELARSDQSEFLRLDRAQRTLSERRAALQAQIQENATKQQSKVEEFRQEMLRRGLEELKRDIKGWSGDLARAINDNAKSYGFTDAELSEVVDPRFVKVLHDAHQWRKLQASKPGLEKRVANARPVKAVSRSAPQAQRDSASVQARQALKKTGRPDAAEAFFESLFSRKR